MRTNISGDDLIKFIEPNEDKLKYLGKMGSGENVYKIDVPGEKYSIYYSKNEKDFMCMTSMEIVNIPNFGQAFQSNVTITKKEYRGKFLSFRLRYFLRSKYDRPILLGDTHSIDTQQALDAVSKKDFFHLFLLNIKTGEKIEWTSDEYKKKTGASNTAQTDWRVLLETVNVQSNTAIEEDINSEFDLLHNWLIKALDQTADEIFDF